MVELAVVCYAAKCCKPESAVGNSSSSRDSLVPSSQNASRNGGLVPSCPPPPRFATSPLMNYDEDTCLRSPILPTAAEHPMPLHLSIRTTPIVKRRRRQQSRTNFNFLKFWRIFKCSPENIDKFSMILFPLCFTVFNATYWWYYIGKGGQVDGGTENFSAPTLDH